MINIGKRASFDERLSCRVRSTFSSIVRDLLKWITSDVISFGGGIPDPTTFPLAEIRRAIDEVFSEYGPEILQYSKTEGIDELRSEICKLMVRRNVTSRADVKDVVITCGSQEALKLIVESFVDPGDVVITESPTYLAMLQVLQAHGSKIIGVPVDESGMRTDSLEDVLRRLRADGRRAKLIYTVPTCQNPTGISMSNDRRKHLIELAETYDVLVVEDDPYSYFLYEPLNVKPLKSLDRTGHVIYVSTFSKILAPGLRVGWIFADERVVNAISIVKQMLTFHTSTLSQYIAYKLLELNVIERVLPMLSAYYRTKRDIMLDALEEYMPSGVDWTRPAGGMFVWVTLPKQMNATKMLPRAIREYKVAYVPGETFYPNRDVFNNMRLNFTYPPHDKIVDGVRRLSKLIRDSMSVTS